MGAGPDAHGRAHTGLTVPTARGKQGCGRTALECSPWLARWLLLREAQASVFLGRPQLSPWRVKERSTRRVCIGGASRSAWSRYKSSRTLRTICRTLRASRVLTGPAESLGHLRQGQRPVRGNSAIGSKFGSSRYTNGTSGCLPSNDLRWTQKCPLTVSGE